MELPSARGIRFVMGCDNDSGWATSKKFMRSGKDEARVKLSAPSAHDVPDRGCPGVVPRVR